MTLWYFKKATSIQQHSLIFFNTPGPYTAQIPDSNDLCLSRGPLLGDFWKRHTSSLLDIRGCSAGLPLLRLIVYIARARRLHTRPTIYSMGTVRRFRSWGVDFFPFGRMKVAYVAHQSLMYPVILDWCSFIMLFLLLGGRTSRLSQYKFSSGRVFWICVRLLFFLSQICTESMGYSRKSLDISVQDFE